MNKKAILIVRDGWGYRKEKRGNAILLANTPNENSFQKYPHTLLKACGNAVGVPEGTQGGSEPGHLTMGAGRIVWQPLEFINQKIKNKEFFKNKVLLKAMSNCRKNNSSLHLMGLFSDQGIHGTIKHIPALLEMAKKSKLKRVFIHAFLDGRDVPERSAEKYFKEVQSAIKKFGCGAFASMAGRYYAMDRDKNYHRTKEAYDLLVYGNGKKEKDAFSALHNFYNSNSNISDYYMPPAVLVDKKGEPVAKINDKDSVVFWNYRSDRARQITEALTQKNFNQFPHKKLKVYYACMSEYDAKFKLPIAFPQQVVKNNLGNVLAANGKKQLRIAETEKYAHVTFFFNSQVEKPNKFEDRILIPSPKVPNYKDKPEMSAYGITEAVLNKISEEKYDFILINFANPDLVGHSGDLNATIQCIEVVDECQGRIVAAGLKHGYSFLITGDHGNAEEMLYPDGSPNPSHGTNQVPCYLISKDKELQRVKLKKGGLGNIGPTVLKVMGLKKPKEFKLFALY